VLLVAVQIASAQLTPRVISLVLRDRWTKFALAFFVFAYTYALGLLAHLREPVPWLSTLLCAYSSLACIGVFLFLIDRVARQLRPVGVLTLVGAQARRIILRVYPRSRSSASGPGPVAATRGRGEPTQVVRSTGPSGVVLAYDPKGLVEAARRSWLASASAKRAEDRSCRINPRSSARRRLSSARNSAG
jgi:uncharacterized membrane protein